MAELLNNKKRIAAKEEADAAIGRLFFYNGLSFNVLKSPFFRSACAAIARAGAQAQGAYVPPSYNHVRTTLLEQQKEQVRAAVSLKRGLDGTGLTLVTDGWTSGTNRQMVNVLLVSHMGAEFLFSVDASSFTKSAEFIAGLLKRALEEVGKERVVQVVTDNAANCLAAGKLITDEFPWITHTPCATHSIDLLLEDFGKVPWVAEIVDAAHGVVKFITRHCKVLDVYRNAPRVGPDGKKRGALELIKPVETRFGTDIMMLNRLVEERDAVEQTVVHPEWATAVSRSADPLAVDLKGFVLDRGFWEDVKFICDLMEPFFLLLREMDSDKPTIGKVYLSDVQCQREVEEGCVHCGK